MIRGNKFSLVCILACALCLPVHSRGAESQLVTADGARADATLESITAEGKFSFRVGNQRRLLAAGNLIVWGVLPTISGDSVALLTDGGQLNAQLLSAEGPLLQLDSPVFGELTLPRAAVRGIVLRAPADKESRDQLVARVLGNQQAEDWLLLDNGDELTGTVLGLDSSTLQLDSQVGPTPIELNRVVALAFGAAVPQLSTDPPPTITGFVDGSWFSVAKFNATAADSARLELTSSAGWKISCSTGDLAFLQPLVAAKYLSDQSAVGYKHIPYLTTEWPYTTDRSVTGGLLRYHDQVFPKGIGMHSTSRLTFDLAPNDRRFAAELALDATAGQRGSVTYRVFVDSQQRYASPVVRGGDAPLPITVDVTGGKRLSLIVDFADRGDELDRANWLNARLMP